jgi:hypothetical protein
LIGELLQQNQRTQNAKKNKMKYPLEYQLHLFRPIYDVHELLSTVIDYIDPKNLIINVQLADKQFHTLCNNNEIWKRACIQNKFDERTEELTWYNDELETIDFKKMFLELIQIDIDKKNEQNGIRIGVEYSKSNRAACGACRKKIDNKVLRVIEERDHEDYYLATRFYHFECFKFPLWLKALSTDKLKSKDANRVINVISELSQKRRRKYLENMPPAYVAYQCDVCKSYCHNAFHECQQCPDYHVCDKCIKSVPIEHKKHKFSNHDIDPIFDCDICGSDIEKVLYHCQVCDSYDICHKCCNQIQAGQIIDNNHCTDHAFFIVGQPPSNKRKREDLTLEDENNKRYRPENAEQKPKLSLKSLMSGFQNRRVQLERNQEYLAERLHSPD